IIEGSARLRPVERRLGLALLLVLIMCAPFTACCGNAGQDAGDQGPAEAASADESPETTAAVKPSSSISTHVASGTPDTTTPLGTLEAYIRAQENGDWAGTADYLTEAAQDDFNDATENMVEDDLIAAGLRFRDEAYKLESS